MFVMVFASLVFKAVRNEDGLGPALVAGGLAAPLGVWLVILFYRWTWRRDRQCLTRLREQYCTIYQVKELPSDAKSIVKPAGAEIQIGDYGWDARPHRRDGLIHLQGLTDRWQVVWHAGFRPDQIPRNLHRNMIIGFLIGQNGRLRRRVSSLCDCATRPRWVCRTIPADILRTILLNIIIAPRSRMHKEPSGKSMRCEDGAHRSDEPYRGGNAGGFNLLSG